MKLKNWKIEIIEKIVKKVEKDIITPYAEIWIVSTNVVDQYTIDLKYTLIFLK